MFGVFYHSQDVVSTFLVGLALMSFSAAIICFLSLSWCREPWRIPSALVGTACLATTFYYVGASSLWLLSEVASAGARFSAWYSVHILQVAAVYFYVVSQNKVSVGVFWRIIGASFLMTFGRWLGDASFFNATLGALISIGFWLYILGEMYFGEMSQVIKKSDRVVRVGYFWLRLIYTIGWAVYPILHFVDVVIGVGQSDGIIALYTVFDILNLIIPAMIVVGVAGQDRY